MPSSACSGRRKKSKRPRRGALGAPYISGDAMHVQTQGLVLRETNYKEADKILTVLTKEGGKRTVKARGCRRKNSPLAASAQLLVWSDMTLFD